MNNDFRTYSELYHYGILGMKWGVRRFQNKDGSLTEEGKRRQKLSDSDAYKEYLSDKNKVDNRYGGAMGLTVATHTAGGVMGGLAAGIAAGGGPVGVATYAAVRIGAMIAALPALGILTHGNDKNIDNIKKSYGKKRIEQMEKLCEQKAKHMTRNDIVNIHNVFGREVTKDEQKEFDRINLDKIEKDIIAGKLSVNDLKKKQSEILKQNKAFYR